MVASSQKKYSEQEIILGIKENNKSILTCLIEKLKPLVCHWIIRHGGSKEQAEDNFQDTWLAVIINIYNGNHKEGNFEAYFIRVSRNQWFRYIRDNPNIFDPIEYDFEDHSEEELLLKFFKDKRYEIVCQKLVELSEKCRNILILRYYEEAEFEDIAAQMNISRKFVKTKLDRCKKYLLRLLVKDPNFTLESRWKKKIKKVWNFWKK